MRTFIPAFLVMGVVLVPSLVWAQTPTADSHPNVVPPTKAPTTLLPPTPLVTESTTVSTTPETAGPIAEPSSIDTASLGTLPLAAFSFGSIVLIIGVGWYLWRRKH